MSRRSWIGGSAALLSLPLLVTTVLAAPAATAAPTSVTNLSLTTKDGVVYVDWTQPSGVPSANV